MNDSPFFNCTGDTVHLAGSLDIYQIETLRKLFLEECSARTSLAVDLSGVSGCDATGVQLLWSVRETVRRKEGAFVLRNIPQAVRDCWAALGLPAELFNS